jgi:hypothetical protein
MCARGKRLGLSKTRVVNGLEATVMDKTLTSDIPSDDKATVLAIDDTSAEIDQVIEHMRKDQAEIEQLKAETRVMLNELMAA